MTQRPACANCQRSPNAQEGRQVERPQEAPPVRIRGTIERVDGNRLMVKARDGSSVNVTLADNARITAMAKAQLSDVKQGSSIGVTAMPQPDGSQKAIGLHIFMESQSASRIN